jgi:hypothetical protein
MLKNMFKGVATHGNGGVTLETKARQSHAGLFSFGAMSRNAEHRSA